MMNVATVFRNAHSHGIRTVVDLPNSWKPGRRRSRLRRRLFLWVGLVVGVFVLVTLVWGLLERER
ncbi:MAG TPA: hypothetical protein EYG11_19350 [Candidatus Latescibacteria bacterium]|nr:hypothetical protein [Candidatus Handelsmanbacteria bacterium]HIL10857.1 hypothetical protein [Candidatus Latescibacterota bacterium]